MTSHLKADIKLYTAESLIFLKH